MDICGKEKEGRARSPDSTCLSLKSDQSKDTPLGFSNQPGLLTTKYELSLFSLLQGMNQSMFHVLQISFHLFMEALNSPQLFLTDFPIRPRTNVCRKDEEGRARSPVSTCLSMKSDQSKDTPLGFSNQPGLLSTKERKRTYGVIKEQEVLRDPESTNCGHSYCRQHVASCGEEWKSAGGISCPQCGKRSRSLEVQTPSPKSTEPYLCTWKLLLMLYTNTPCHNCDACGFIKLKGETLTHTFRESPGLSLLGEESELPPRM